ncbi:MAG: hypothetical protein Q8P67_05835, partial [archaeon]|nr:hypothetical protein [archaeon]
SLLALVAFALVFTAVQCAPVINSCIQLAQCTDVIVLQDMDSTQFGQLYPRPFNNPPSEAYTNGAGNFASDTTLSVTRLSLILSTTTLNTFDWYDSVREDSLFDLSYPNPCPFPKCPYGFVLLPSNTSHCTPASGFPSTGVPADDNIDAFTSLGDCLSSTASSETPFSSVSFRTRTCMSEYNKLFKNCLAYQGLLG